MLINRESIKEYYLEIIKKEWLMASDLFPDFLTEIPSETKFKSEQYAKKVSEDFNKQVKSFPRLPIGRKKWKQKMLPTIHDLLYHENVIGIHNSMEKQEIEAFQEEIMNFLRHVRKFAPELSFDEIGQALRNYIVYAMFKNIHEIKNDFSMAGFGYSMLYPFTDNYIDSRTYSAEEKAEYNKIIRDKIVGREVHPRTIHQKKTCDLLQAIESEYPRESNTTVFTLLLMMLEAQEESLRQQNKGVPLSEEERLAISLYKGGISVLIDRFLVRKELTKEEVILYLGLGFFLQLADDLQDIRTDDEEGWQTLLTLDKGPANEEKYINKLLHFIHNIMGAYQAENNRFKDFVLSNCYQLIFTSVIGSKEFFSPDYINWIEKYLPVTYQFFEDMKKGLIINQDSKTQKNYMKVMDEIIAYYG